MPPKKFHKQLILKLKTALREARDCVVFYKDIVRRTAESNCIPFARYRPGLIWWSTPVDDILRILRKNEYSKNNNLSQEGEVIHDTLRYAVPLMRPSNNHYSTIQNVVKSGAVDTAKNDKEITIPQNETREVFDVTTAENDGRFPDTFTVRAQKNARVTYVLAVFGNREITKDITLELQEGAEGRIIGVIIGSGKGHFTLKTTLRHRAPRTKGDIKIKMVLKDTSYVSYDGLIKIDKPAQQTNSYLDARALILDRGAKCDGKPELEIEADDVKASHAFSSGKIDSEQLFYLRSRGLTEAEAKQMIMEGFLFQVLQGLSTDLQKNIQNKIKREIKLWSI